jgi:hypothetical protein
MQLSGSFAMYLVFWTLMVAQFVCLLSRTKWENLDEKESRKTKRNSKQEKEKEKKESER